ncbi:2546_t:CDS:2 [Funneliformis mosseae]|uniref:2546_t:CDS:1 n=1 Tax=Funneliformis mosseae TaxID=27381 RepID=A0A9N9D900_FUNMO|nr:2546_t:CDS:2 [Funneliformis mosseae]
MSISSSKQLILSTYRQILKEINKQFTNQNNNQLWRKEAISTFQQYRNLSNKEEVEKLTQDAQDLLCFLKSNRKFDELLKSYNPVHGYSEEKRIELTAKRVGLKLPITITEKKNLTQITKDENLHTESDKGKIF